jgi:hypothetical protein
MGEHVSDASGLQQVVPSDNAGSPLRVWHVAALQLLLLLLLLSFAGLRLTPSCLDVNLSALPDMTILLLLLLLLLRIVCGCERGSAETFPLAARMLASCSRTFVHCGVPTEVHHGG